MANSYLTNIYTRKIITENVTFIICTSQIMYNKKNMSVEQMMQHFLLNTLNLKVKVHFSQNDFVFRP